MIELMLDTDTCIYVMQHRNAELRGKLEAKAGRLCISSISLAELYYGAEKSARQRGNMETIENFVARLEVLPFSIKAARHFGELRNHLRRMGTPVGPLDMLIGAHARSEALILVTNNRREFDRMPDLQVENWVN